MRGGKISISLGPPTSPRSPPAAIVEEEDELPRPRLIERIKLRPPASEVRQCAVELSWPLLMVLANLLGPSEVSTAINGRAGRSR